MPDESTATEAWVRGHVATRFAATVWWVVMVLITIGVVGGWINLAIGRTWGDLVTVGILMLVFVPIGREWPNASRMWRMLRHGT